MVVRREDPKLVRRRKWVGRCIRALLEVNGVTREQIARVMHFEHESAVRKLERGQRRLDVVELITLCRAFRLLSPVMAPINAERMLEAIMRGWDEDPGPGFRFERYLRR